MDRAIGCFVGSVVGDAFGAAYEFRVRDKYEVSPNMKTTVYALPPGSFTDDSSMALCLGTSLLERGGFDPLHQMQLYSKWRREGYMSSCPEKGCFDIGRATAMAIGRYDLEGMMQERAGEARVPSREYWGSQDPCLGGNGGIMRLAPIPIYYRNDPGAAREYAALSSKVTHDSPACLDAAEVMALVIVRLLAGADKRDALTTDFGELRTEEVRAITEGSFVNKTRDDIRTSGYVVHTLEAAMWALWHATSFEDGMMTLAAMGEDVDTVCAVYGAMAGACYGYGNIPRRWIESLQRRDLVEDIANRLWGASA